MEAIIVRRKMCLVSEKSSEKIIKSSERSSETTAISSGTGSGTGSETGSETHPHKVLVQAKRQRRAWGHPYNRNQASFFSSYIKLQKQACDFYHKELLFR